MLLFYCYCATICKRADNLLSSSFAPSTLNSHIFNVYATMISESNCYRTEKHTLGENRNCFERVYQENPQYLKATFRNSSKLNLGPRRGVRNFSPLESPRAFFAGVEPPIKFYSRYRLHRERRETLLKQTQQRSVKLVAVGSIAMTAAEHFRSHKRRPRIGIN